MAFGLGDIVDAVVDGASDVGGAIVAFGQNTYSAAADAIDGATERAADLAEAAYEEAAEAVDEILEDLERLAEDTWEEGRDAWSEIENLGENAWEDAGEFLESSADAFMAAVDDVVESALAAAEDAWNDFGRFAEETWDAFERAVEDPLRDVADAVEDVYDSAAAMAIDLSQSVARAIDRALAVIEQITLFIGNVVWSIIDLIARLGACLAGQAIYLLTKADLVLINTGFAVLGATVKYLSAEFQNRLSQLFGGTDFANVLYQEQSHLPEEYIDRDETDAMTMGGVELAGVMLDYMIYVRDFVTRFDGDVRLLVHELVHVTQYHRTGSEMAFACAYGMGYKEGGGSYRENPLEDEAYDFVTAHYHDINAWELSADP